MNQQLSDYSWRHGVFVLIPTFSAAEQLNTLLPRLINFVPVDRVCVVDDGSRDSTPQVCRRYGVECLVHYRNRGKGAALADGFAYLIRQGAVWIITMDADGQHSPTDLPRFLQAISQKENAGIIIGARQHNPRIMPADRIISNTLTSFILSIITGMRIRDSQCGFRAYNASFLTRVNIVYRRFEMESEMIVKAKRLGYNVHFIPVQTIYSHSSLQHSHIAYVADTMRWLVAIIRLWLKLD